MKRIVNGLLILCLMASLTGCARSKTEVIEIPVEKLVVEKIKAPDELLADCPEPNLDSLRTTGDLERLFAEALVSLRDCNADKAQLREWQER